MKTKIIPFYLELAKKIQAGEIEGKIVTNNGYTVRIICFDKRTSSGYPILGLVDYPSQSEMCKAFNTTGLCYGQPVEFVLQIELPEEEPKHEFKPFEQVLVRQSDKDYWRAALYSHYNQEENLHVTAWLSWYQCIPYEGNEQLVGTTNKPKED